MKRHIKIYFIITITLFAICNSAFAGRVVLAKATRIFAQMGLDLTTHCDAETAIQSIDYVQKALDLLDQLSSASSGELKAISEQIRQLHHSIQTTAQNPNRNAYTSLGGISLKIIQDISDKINAHQLSDALSMIEDFKRSAEKDILYRELEEMDARGELEWIPV